MSEPFTRLTTTYLSLEMALQNHTMSRQQQQPCCPRFPGKIEHNLIYINVPIEVPQPTTRALIISIMPFSRSHCCFTVACTAYTIVNLMMGDR